MKDWDDVVIDLGMYGVIVGLCLIASPLIWDIFWMGGRKLFKFAITWRGYLVIAIGWGITVAGYVVEKRLNR